jgi:colanic acid/amylovoran biosynthesis protein
MTSKFKIVTFAVPLSGNKGSASMLTGLREAFDNAGINTHFSVFSYYPYSDKDIAKELDNVSVHPGHPKDIAFKLLPLLFMHKISPALIHRSWKDNINKLQNADVILLIGGTTFSDAMLYKVPWNLLAALPGILLGKSIICLSQTIGPMNHPLNKRMARWVLNKTVAVHGRGRQSAQILKDNGISRHHYRPDLSFAMKPTNFDDLANRSSAGNALRHALLTGQKAIGIAPNSIVFNKAKKHGINYIDFLVNAIKTVYDNGFIPVLIPHSYRHDIRSMHNNDRSLCINILKNIPQDIECIYIDEDLDSADLRAVIGKMHILIASRFHSMISALSMGVPPLTYGWGHHKYSEVLEEFGVGDLYTSYEYMDNEHFSDKLSMIHQSRQYFSGQIKKKLVEVKAQALNVPYEIIDAVGFTHN